MKKYAVIKINNKQYKVEEGEELLVDKLSTKKPTCDVLLVKNGKKVEIGTPNVKGAKVTLKIIEDEVKGKKLTVKKFRSKSRYRKTIGFKPIYTKLQVGKITA